MPCIEAPGIGDRPPCPRLHVCGVHTGGEYTNYYFYGNEFALTFAEASTGAADSSKGVHDR